MNKIKILLGASALLFSSVLNAAIIEYSISGSAFYYPVGERFDSTCPSDHGCDDVLTGSMYVSDVRDDNPDPSTDDFGDYYEVISFAFNVGDYGYAGVSGVLNSNDVSGTFLTLSGTGGLGYNSTIGFSQSDSFLEFPVLPETYTFMTENRPSTTTDGLFESFITAFTITKVASVPEPSIVVLLVSGLLLIGFTRSKA